MICGRCGGEMYYWGNALSVEWFVCKTCKASVAEQDEYLWYPTGDVPDWEPDEVVVRRGRKRWLVK